MMHLCSYQHEHGGILGIHGMGSGDGTKSKATKVATNKACSQDETNGAGVVGSQHLH